VNWHFNNSNSYTGGILNTYEIKTNLVQVLLCSALLAASVGAHAEVVIVTGSGTPTGSMSKEQVSDIFLGKSKSLTPLDQPSSSPLREEFYTKVTGKSAAQAKSHWSKLSFTGKGTPPKEGRNSDDIKRQVAADPKLIGYIEKSDVDSSVKVIFAAQ